MRGRCGRSPRAGTYSIEWPPITGESITEPESPPQKEIDYRRLTVAIIAALIVIAFVVFVSQNNEDVPVEFLNVEYTVALWLLVLIAMVAGALLWGGLSWLRRRRRAARRVQE